MSDAGEKPTPAELAAARAAERLLADPVLTEALDELTRSGIHTALFGSVPSAREDARREVIAIDRLRSSLRGAVEHVIARQGGDPKTWE